jgi:EmrB/QacA subfamily drug resistance transporter
VRERTHPNLVLAVLATGGTTYALLQSMVAPALPDLQHALHTTTSGVAWVLTSYLLSASVATPILGRLGDMYGKERLLVIVLALLAFGTVISAVATSLPVMLLGRVIQGAAGSIFPLAFAIIRDEFPREKVASSIGLVSALLGIGGGAGIVLAGVIVDHFSYHWLFWFPLIGIVAATIATILWVPESPVRSPAKINWTGAALLSLGLAGFLVAVSEGQAWGWSSARYVGVTAVSLVVLALWVRVESRAPEPLVDMRMMRLRGVWTTNLAALLVGAGMYGSFVLIPEYVETARPGGFGGSVTVAGLYMLPCASVMLLAGPLAGRIDRWAGSKVAMVLGAGLAALSFLMLGVAHSHPWEVIVAMGLLGAGIGLAFAAMANLIVAAVPQTQTGVATAMNAIARTVGGSFGSAVLAGVVASNTVAGVAGRHGFVTCFWIAAGVLVVSVLASLAIPGRERVPAPKLAAA